MSSFRNEQTRTAGIEIPPGIVHPDIAERVLRHFKRNAQAMDSAEGIAHFWLGEKSDLVGPCLADMHARGVLAKRTIAGIDFYSLRKTTAVAPGQQPNPAGQPSTQESEAHARILVVEDEPAIQELLRELLTEAGYEVSVADRFEQAIDRFRVNPCDLVLTDLRMPGLSGIEVLKSIKQIGPETEVIIVTGHASVDTTIDAIHHGAYDLVTKPITDLESLLRVVSRALEKRRLSIENRLLLQSLHDRNQKLKETVGRLAAVNDIGRITTSLLDVTELYQSLADLIAQHLEASRVSVLLSDLDSDTMSVVASIGITERDILSQPVRIGEGLAGSVAASQAPLLVHDIERSEFRDLRSGRRYSTPSFLIAPLLISYPGRNLQRQVGVITVSDKHSGDPFTEQDVDFLSTLTRQVAVAIENAHLIKDMQDGFLGAMLTLVQAFEDTRPETRGHSRRVATLAAVVARSLGLPDSRIELVVRAAALHEVGRLLKPADDGGRSTSRGQGQFPWTPEAIMATEKLLAPIPSLRDVREILFHATEELLPTLPLDGVGRSRIPVESRILAMCEAFDHLTRGDIQDTKRARKAVECIRTYTRDSKDRDVVEALRRLVEEGASR